MTPDEIERAALTLFERYLETPLSRRATLLAEATRDAPELRARIEAMLAADREGQLRTGGAVDQIDETPPPERIGAYAIVGLIGHGGMGSVYRATRAAGDFAHDVAIKLIKPGILTKQLDERFRAERSTLAGLRHPNIAQLYDGGETAEGAPYIVMELVDGAPLLAWADENNLAADARARLFVMICEAVAFAHRNLVVHRDITPSNILVTADGTPKLIDFGISKPAADDAPDTDGAAVSIGSLSLTPGYAAPERMLSARVTTAADIYSLGKVLAALIRDRDADLEAIVARAAAPTPAERYPTAGELAADVGAWRGGYPVAARQGDWRYRLARFVRRNRAMVSLGALAAVGLTVAFGLTIVAYARAESARRAEAARFAELRALAGFMLFDLNGSLSRVVGTAEARLNVVNRAQTYLAGLARGAGADPAVRLEAARGYVALALIRGVPGQPNLGQTEAARTNLAEAIALAARTPAAASVTGHALALRALIEMHADGKPDVAAKTLEQATRTLDAGPPGARNVEWFAARSQLRRAQVELATLRQEPGAILAAVKRLTGEIAEWPAALRQSRAAELDRATADHAQGIRLYFLDRFDEAIPFIQAADRRLAELDRAQPNEPAVAYLRAYNAYLGSNVASSADGREREVDAFLATARSTIDRLMAVEPNDSMVMAMAGTIRGAEAQALSARGQYEEALTLQRENVETYAALLKIKPSPANRTRQTLAQIVLANIARLAGDEATACAAYGRIEQGMAEMARKGELIDYVGNYRPNVQVNIRHCGDGATGKLVPL